MGSAGTLENTLLGAPATLALDDADLALFVLNVGDGDSLVLRFPSIGSGAAYGIVDCFHADKTLRLLDDLGASRLRFVCATHPHFDHIKGLRAVLKAYDGQIDEFWDSGFRFTSATYQALIQEVERQHIRFVRPTSGFEADVNGARLTVLSPSIYLRNRYDTYGVDANNASIVLRVAYPENPPSTDYPKPSDVEKRKSTKALLTRTLILGGDAQTDAWGRVMDEFPHFRNDEGNWARQISARTGRQPLACDLFKVSHHGSKRGINLELVERMGDTTGQGPSDGPRILVISSASDADSTYGFPHSVTQELLREVRDPQAQAGGTHPSDGEMGIHHTAQTLASPASAPAGSVAFVSSANGARSLYRFGDRDDELVDLQKARRVRNVR